ncbi:MAG: 30S ribosomal protein S3 [Chloroflexi bacterium]|nr:30S ribosomal protein S3 [Chloroflexota bacterium]
MGHKSHPIGMRLGIIRDWESRWYAGRDYKRMLHEDIDIRKLIRARLKDAGVPRIDIERSSNQVSVTIHSAKPGIVIGKSGAKVEELRKTLEERTSKRVRINIQEIRQPELDATLVARSVAEQIERRVAFRRAIKQTAQRSMQRGAKGVRIVIAGRLGGSEMSRRERELAGSVPLHTLRADIDFGLAEAHTTFGVIGVKAWIFRGEIIPDRRRGQRQAPRPAPATDADADALQDALAAPVDGPPPEKN